MRDLPVPAGGACSAPGAPPAAPRRSSRGTVTAETAVAIPILVAVTLGLVWLVSLAVTQVRVVDAARETARAYAREEPVATALALGREVAPVGSRIDVHEDADVVRVRVAADVRGPGGLFDFLPGVVVDAEAVAAMEQP